MKNLKKYLSLAIPLFLCLSLAACGGIDQNEDPNDVVGDDWRVSGIVRDGGIITRGGKDTNVLVCINAYSADFYLDEEVQTLYDYVNYPITLQGDLWEEFQSISFADLNGDDNGDVSLMFELDDVQTLMVWFWDADTESYVFQPEESQVSETAD